MVMAVPYELLDYFLYGYVFLKMVLIFVMRFTSKEHKKHDIKKMFILA